MYRKLVKFGRVVFESCERTKEQTDTLIAIVRILFVYLNVFKYF